MISSLRRSRSVQRALVEAKEAAAELIDLQVICLARAVLTFLDSGLRPLAVIEGTPQRGAVLCSQEDRTVPLCGGIERCPDCCG
jgi:hypothetical protein